MSPRKGGGHSSTPARPHHWYTRALGFLTKKLEIHLSKRSGISFKNRRTQTSRQTEATILVKTLSPVEAKQDPAVVWVWPDKYPSVTSAAGPEGDGEESHFLLSTALTRGRICFLGQSLRLPCGRWVTGKSRSWEVAVRGRRW